MNEKKQSKSRIEKRAEAEVAVVKACKTHMQEKVQAMTEQRNVAKAKKSLIEEEIICAADEGEDEIVIQRMIEDLSFAEKQIAFSDGMISVFMAVRNVLSDLSIELDSILQLQWYKYVIRTIPEKKLPKMLQSEKQRDLQRVMELTQAILQKVEDKIAATIQDKAEFERVMTRIKVTAAEQKKKYDGVTSVNVGMAVEEIRQRKKQETARRVQAPIGIMPVPASDRVETVKETQIKA